MKKHLTILSFAMTMLMAFTASFTLTSCGEEVDIDPVGPNPPVRTVFSAGPVNFGAEEGTRTSMDSLYYWEYDDQIWVNDNGTWLKSSDSQLAPDNRSANFYYDKLFKADSLQVVYTGIGNNSATKVKIPATFASSSASNMGIGSRGDCGVATAYKQADGTYKFSLRHKASYLGVAPFRVSYLKKYYRWTKIEITDVNGKAIAGTFGFSPAGIDTTSVTSPSSKITLTLQGPAIAALQDYSGRLSYIYTVIPPCKRQLNVKYYFVEDANPTDTMIHTRKLRSLQYIENNVTRFFHGISAEYYQWDAPKTEPHDVTRTGTNKNNSTVAPGTQATKVCATMPNANEMYWYLAGGDPRWDNETKWTMDGVSWHTGGAWIKKKQYITGFSSTVGANGVDMRTTATYYPVNTTTYRSGGKPADTSQYFFLPAMGCYWGSANLAEVGVNGWYWSSSSHPTNPAKAYRLLLHANAIQISCGNDNQTEGNEQRKFAFIAGKGSDWFK